MDGMAARQPPPRASDLTAAARIRNAALEGFAERGIAATSIRDVAAAAGVSPGLVQHHFKSKAGLRDAVNAYVIETALETFQGLVGDEEAAADWTAMGNTVTAWVREQAVAVRYVARALAEGDPEAAKIFDGLIAIARRNWLEPLAEQRALATGIDQEWAAIHVVVFNLASVLFEAAISRHLPEPLLTPAELERWNRATAELYRRALSPHDTSV